MTNAGAKRAKMLLFIVKYANLLAFCVNKFSESVVIHWPIKRKKNEFRHVGFFWLN